MKKLLDNAIHWLEYGDLVPLIVIVSAAHYASILQDKDHMVVAWAIGLMVDLGHFRTVRAAVRYGNKNWKETAVRWTMAGCMTVVAIAYQQRYYEDFWLSLPLPFLIAALAWLHQKDANVGHKPASTDKPASKPRKVSDKVLTNADKVPTESRQMPTFSRGYDGFVEYVAYCREHGLKTGGPDTIAARMKRSRRTIERYTEQHKQAHAPARNGAGSNQ